MFLIFLFSGLLYSQDFQNLTWKEIQHQNRNWYGSEQAIRIADNVILHQNVNGGWLKNTDLTKEITPNEKHELKEKKTKTIGPTIDNGTTHTQLRYLAKVYFETQIEKYKNGFLKGINYLLKAQYENGGWPQYYPIREGYYEHITFNDNAMIGVMNLLRNVASEDENYRFVGEDIKKESEKAIQKGLDVILKTQVRIDGQPTLWCAQHHHKDLSPAKARAYELPSLSGAESVGIIRYLMQIENPSEEVKESIRSAISWFEKHKITGKKVIIKDAPDLPGGKDRVVVENSKAGPLWARFNEIGTGRPIFVGRDGIPKNKLNEIEHERRMGYSYLGNYAEKLLKEDYPKWEKRISTE
ncbi:pectate lyase [Salegentibacter salinarum]|uniref:pectate lyase n=1 Tax=Salegentibacter salinarum TaxID=447422 RepID=UPI001E520E0A|nr:pectate lyase [Salegentibacter salinarum]